MTCPHCKSEVIAKCGSINVWHWAHIDRDCDLWSEPESDWHKEWKEKVPLKNREVTINNHRADILLAKGLVVELQNSSISVENIRERENFYGEMVWLFNAQEFMNNCIIKYYELTRYQSEYQSEGYTLGILSDIEKYKQFMTSMEWAVWAERELQRREIDSNAFLKKKGVKQDLFDLLNSDPRKELIMKEYYDMKKIPEKECHPLSHGGYSIQVIGSKSVDNVLGQSSATRSINFKWLWARKTLLTCSKPILWDIGSHTLLYFDSPTKNFCSTNMGVIGSGKLIPKQWFLDFLISES